MNLDNELALAQRLADSAGEIIRRHWKSVSAVENKADASPVTQADREVETALRAGIEKAFPAHGIIGEEYGNVRGESPWQWVIDPIDGTRAFIAGQPTFATLIALAKDGIPLLGIIDQPISKERWVGVSGKPTLFHSAKPPVVQPENYRNAVSHAYISTTSTDYFTPEETARYEKLRARCARSQLGGDAYAYGMLANGRLDIVVDAGMKPYDYCALRPVIEGAEGVITDWQGKPLTIHSNGSVLAAATEGLHQQVLALLNND